MDEDRIKQLIRDELADILGRDKFVLDRVLQILDGRDIITGRTTGTKIGTAADQKLGFFGATPIARPVAPTNATTIISTLQSLGLTQ